MSEGELLTRRSLAQLRRADVLRMGDSELTLAIIRWPMGGERRPVGPGNYPSVVRAMSGLTPPPPPHRGEVALPAQEAPGWKAT